MTKAGFDSFTNFINPLPGGGSRKRQVKKCFSVNGNRHKTDLTEKFALPIKKMIYRRMFALRLAR